jgi:hypothetical protein
VKFTILVKGYLLILNTCMDLDSISYPFYNVLHINTVHQVWPRRGERCSTPGMTKFTILVGGCLLALLYDTFSLYYRCAVLDKKNLKLVNFLQFCPTLPPLRP